MRIYKIIRDYFSKVFSWFYNAKYLWLFLFLTLGVQLVDNIDIFNYSVEYKIQLYGLILQLAGTLILLHSINHKLKIFKGLSLFEKAKKHFKEFPLPKPRKKSKGINIEGMSSGSSSGYVTLTAKKVLKDNDPKSIMDFIEEKIKETNEQVDRKSIEVNKRIDEIGLDIKNKNNAINSQISTLKSQLETTSVSDNGVDIFSIVIIFLGLIYGTAAPTIYQFLRWLAT